MRILQIHNQYALPGGEDTISDAEAELLRAAGHDVETFRVVNAGAGSRALASLAGAAWNPRQKAAMAQRVCRNRPDLAHVHNTWFTLSPAVIHALHEQRVPVVMTLQNYRLLCGNALLFRDGAVCTECLGGSHWRVVAHGCYRDSRAESVVAALAMTVSSARGTWGLVDRFLAPSRFVKSVFVNAGFDPDRIVVRGNIAADPGPRPQRPSVSDTVVYVGRLSVEKGVDVLVTAWRDARPSDLRLLVVGDGPLRAELEAMEVPGVHFAGWLGRAELEALLLRARAMVMPTQWLENFGRVVVEAMAAGLPVLASDIATPAEVVGEIGPEWLVEPTRGGARGAPPPALGDDAHVDAGGARARELYLRKYSEPIGLDSLLKVYSDVLAFSGR